jgi:hypothetical protein
MNKSNLIRSILAAELILLIPFVAMFFTEEVDWKVPDFIIVGILLAGIGYAYRLIVDGIKSSTKQVAIGIMLAAVIILIWIELAVGIFGSPFAGS